MSEPAVRLPPVEQIGIVVRDVDRAVDFFTSVFGWGPFKVREGEQKGFTYDGRMGDCRLKMAFARSGGVEIELIQVLEGETPHSDFLRRHGEGLQHLRFRVDDIDGMTAALAREGVEPLWSQRFPGVAAFAYMKANKTSGLMVELFEKRESGNGRGDPGAAAAPSGIVLPPVDQVGLVVRDLEKAAAFYYSAFGLGPFSIVPEVRFDGVALRGRPTDSSIKVAFADSGPLQIELIQPLEGDNIYTEFLQAGHEGLHHLGFRVDDFDGLVAGFQQKGIGPVFWKHFGFTAFAYLDTAGVGGVVAELLWPRERRKRRG
jgi:methylmalonyl-CoA/ethylmalonyl-CoA epimerase